MTSILKCIKLANKSITFCKLKTGKNMTHIILELIEVSFHFQNPPAIVKFVMESICVMLALKPERKPDPSTGKMMEDFWGPSQKLLGDMKFLDRLKAYDKDNIAPAIMKKIREKYVMFFIMKT